MARLFITPREQALITDLTKEVIKDIVGQFIYYYPISEIRTKVHAVYNEATQKIFDNPIKVDCLVGNNETTVKTADGNIDYMYQLEVYIPWADLVDKGFDVTLGDFFQFGGIFYEITATKWMRNIYGQTDHVDGYQITGTKSRKGLFASKIEGPTDYVNTDEHAQQTEFYQQRGLESNAEGLTNDKRHLQESGALTEPIDGQREVSANGDPDHRGNAFYDEK
jgi:hypothetical protein